MNKLRRTDTTLLTRTLMWSKAVHSIALSSSTPLLLPLTRKQDTQFEIGVGDGRLYIIEGGGRPLPLGPKRKTGTGQEEPGKIVVGGMRTFLLNSVAVVAETGDGFEVGDQGQWSLWRGARLVKRHARNAWHVTGIEDVRGKKDKGVSW
jgi:hypothetical protein